MNPSWIAGVDGFRREWFVVLVNHAQGRVIETRHHVCSSFEEVLNLAPAPKVVAIDIPIGPVRHAGNRWPGMRPEKKRILKSPHASSVFSPEGFRKRYLICVRG